MPYKNGKVMKYGGKVNPLSKGVPAKGAGERKPADHSRYNIAKPRSFTPKGSDPLSKGKKAEQ